MLSRPSAGAARLLQVLGQAARVALRRLGRRAQPFAEALLGAAEMHLGERALAQRRGFGRCSPSLRRVLLGAPDGHLQQLRDACQPHGIASTASAFEDGGHQARLVVDQDQLGLRASSSMAEYLFKNSG